MTALTATLGARGLLVRGAEPGRGRLSRLGLTSDGRELLARAWPIVIASNDWFGRPVLAAGASGADVVEGTLLPMLGDEGSGAPA